VVLERVEVTVGSVGSTLITVLFLATLEGVVHKVTVFPRGSDTESPPVCLVEAINLSERPRPGLIRSLQLHAAKVPFTVPFITVILKPRLHDTTGWQTGCTTGLTSACIV